MIRIAISSLERMAYYRFNKDHIVCISSPELNMLCVSVMDNNEVELDHRWCEYTSMYEIEKIVIKMLRNLGCNLEIIEDTCPEGWACYYLPESNQLEFPIVIHYYRESPAGCSILKKETITCQDEYLMAMTRHRKNHDSFKSIGPICLEELRGKIRSINEYMETAMSQLQYLSDTLATLSPRSYWGFRKDFVDQIDEAYKLNLYLLDKIRELESKLPKGLYLVYPSK